MSLVATVSVSVVVTTAYAGGFIVSSKDVGS